MTLPDSITYLRRFQAWRYGKDDRSFDETGLSPDSIGNAIETILSKFLIMEQELRSARSQLAKCQVQREKFHAQLRKASKEA